MDTRIAVTTAQGFEGHKVVKHLGVVRGIVVRAPGIGRGILGGLKSIVGGNVGSFEQVCEEARSQAFQRMVDHALQVGANAVVAMHYDATEFSAGITEVLCYGTAVQLQPAPPAM